MTEFRKAWSAIDSNMDGTINESHLSMVLERLDIDAKDKNIHRMIAELGIPSRGTVEYNEFLEIISSAKEDRVKKQSHRLSAGSNEKVKEAGTGIAAEKTDRSARIPTERSGGGV